MCQNTLWHFSPNHSGSEASSVYSWCARNRKLFHELSFILQTSNTNAHNFPSVHVSLYSPYIVLLIIELYIVCTFVIVGDCLFPVNQSMKPDIIWDTISVASSSFLPVSIERRFSRIASSAALTTFYANGLFEFKSMLNPVSAQQLSGP